VADCILLMSLDKVGHVGAWQKKLLMLINYAQQPSVVPVDTHVYQIAVRHYGLRAPSGKSPAMTPKIYADVANRLQNVWGPYAGWAHSVSVYY
jgi:N-glycosylase/DNA lyase